VGKGNNAMKDQSGTNQELIEEISALKQRIKELEHSKSELKQKVISLKRIDFKSSLHF
jgi:prefoldin subunit 5